MSQQIDALKRSEISEIEDDDTKCGFGTWKPDWLQRFANPKMFFLIFCIMGIVQGAYFSYVAGILSTIEKRYSFKSKVTAIILIADNISPIIISTLVGYYGSKANRPRWIAGGMFLVVLSYFISAFPYFIYGTATHLMSDDKLLLGNSTKTEYCNKYLRVDSCKDGTRSITVPAVICFVLGSFLKGFGSTAFYTIGTPYLDDNIKKRHSPLYLGLLGVFRLFGPTLGYLLSSACLKYYENPALDPGFSRNDPRWVGAWWIGFILLGIILLLLSFLLLLFPRRLRKIKTEQKIQQNNNYTTMKELPQAVKRLVVNPFLVCFLLASALRYSSMLGYYITVPRYVETQYRQAAAEANLYSGPTAIISAQIGILISSIVIHRYTPRARYLLCYWITVEFLSLVGFLVVMALGCPGLTMPGTTLLSQSLDLQNECNKGCECTTAVAEPVCAPDGQSSYFSPCFAGCTGYNGTVYTGCKCLPGLEQFANKGYCSSDCNMIFPYLSILAVTKLISSSSSVIQILVLFRCVDTKDKTLVMGFMETVLSVISFIPYPIIYTAITDAACIVWEESCGKTGNCWLYHPDKFRYYVHTLTSGLLFFCVIFDCGMLMVSNRLRDIYEEEDEQKIDGTDDTLLSQSPKSIKPSSEENTTNI